VSPTAAELASPWVTGMGALPPHDPHSRFRSTVVLDLRGVVRRLQVRELCGGGWSPIDPFVFPPAGGEGPHVLPSGDPHRTTEARSRRPGCLVHQRVNGTTWLITAIETAGHYGDLCLLRNGKLGGRGPPPRTYPPDGQETITSPLENSVPPSTLVRGAIHSCSLAILFVVLSSEI
jgi:hypothetical protein